MMKKFIFLIFIILSFNICFAQIFYEYFNYSPRTTKKFDLSLLKKISQDIKIFDDNLGKIFIWLNNPQEENIIEVSLKKNEKVIFSKTIEIPKMPLTFFGNKFEINLGNNLKIKSGDNYKLVINHLQGKGLTIFTSEKIQILQATEIFGLIPKSFGEFYIQEESYPYNLKLALGEFPEKEPPQFINPQIIIKNPYLTSIIFNSNEPLRYRLIYWDKKTGDAFVYSSPGNFELCHPEIKNCEINLITNPNTSYSFQLTIFDYWGNFQNYEGSFTTPEISGAPIIIPLATSSPDNEVPEIFDFEIKEITHNNIKVAFKTNEYTLSSMKIFYKETGVIVLEILNPIFNLYHELEAKNLLFPNLDYYAIIKVEDLSKNQNEMRFEFKTKNGPTNQSLNQFLSNPKKIEQSNINYSSSEEFKPVNFSTDLDLSSNKLKLENYSERQNLEAVIFNRNQGSFLTYSIKEKGIDINLNILSPGVYSYIVYEKINQKTKRLIESGEFEIKNQQKTMPLTTSTLTKENQKSKTENIKKDLTIQTTAKPTLSFDIKKRSYLVLILLIFILILVLIFKKFKK